MRILTSSHLQFITIVKVIVETIADGEEMRGVDIMSTFLKVANLLSQLQDPAAQRLKVKYCSLCDSFLDKSELFPVRKDNGSRIGIADLIIEWTQEVVGVCPVYYRQLLY